MFRPLQASLGKIQKDIQTRQKTQKLVGGVVDEYLKELFGPRAQVSVTSVYDEEKEQLTLEVPSKTYASEILLRSGEIGALLRQKGTRVKRLLVR